MDFEVYCDESCPEALSQKDAHLYTTIGGIWIPKENRSDLKDLFNKLKEANDINGEFKWQKVSPAYFNLYKALIDAFFSAEYVRFRVILIESDKVDHIRFNNKDAELGFYKFYYQLLHHWIFDFNSYNIFVDLKTKRHKGRISDLHKVLSNANLTSEINQIQSLPSDESIGIQVADFFTGLVAAKFNDKLKSDAKITLIKYIEENYLKKEIAPTSKWEEKFNVFKINLNGGW